MLSSYNLKNKQTIQISGLVLQYCSATTLYRRLLRAASNFPTAYVRIASQTYVLQHIYVHAIFYKIPQCVQKVFHLITYTINSL